MTRLEQLIYNICNSGKGSIMFRFKLKDEAKRRGYVFGNNDEKFLKELVEKGFIDKEELFCEWLDILIRNEEINPYILDTFPYFNPECYFPELVNKNIAEGAWIRIQTERGFNVYFAKSSSKKKIDYDRKLKELDAKRKFSNKTSKSIDLELKKITNQKNILNEIIRLQTEQAIGIDPYYISYRISKTKNAYAMSYEYELIEDINLYMTNAYKRVKLKPYFEGEIKDKVFYLQSRGISKNLAIQMVVAGQAYFEVDIKGMIEDEHEANKDFKLTLTE